MAANSVTPPAHTVPMYECGYAHLIREAAIVGIVAAVVIVYVWKETSKAVSRAVRFP